MTFTEQLEYAREIGKILNATSMLPVDNVWAFQFTDAPHLMVRDEDLLDTYNNLIRGKYNELLDSLN